MTSQDLKKGIDVTGLEEFTASEFNQSVDAGRVADDKGLNIVTTDTAIDVPEVPDPNTLLEGVIPTFWTRYTWIRKPHENAPIEAKNKIYTWNPNRTSDATLLRWEHTDLTALEALAAAEDASTEAQAALNQATIAVSSAGTALTNSDAALFQIATVNGQIVTITGNIEAIDTLVTALEGRMIQQEAESSSPRPVATGGTGGSSPTEARINLGIEKTVIGWCFLKDVKAVGINGGTFTAGAWQTRELNTENATTGDGVTLNGDNTFQLQRGSYIIEAEVPAYSVNLHKARLYDVSNATPIAYGSSESATQGDDNDPSISKSKVFAIVTVTLPTIFRIEHFCQTTVANTGFGIACNFVGASEVYTQVKITTLGA